MLHFYHPFSKNQYDPADFTSGESQLGYWGSWVTWGRWLSYYNQINEVLRIAPRGSRILEVGPGEQITSHVLRKFGYDVVTLDKDPSLGSDIVADIRDMDLPADSFDVVLAFQVLEHVPYEDFGRVLRNFHRVTKRFCVISLPLSGPEVVVALRLPRVPFAPAFPPFGRPLTLSFKLTLPQRPRRHPLPKHQWEMGKRGYSMRRIKRDLRDAGFTIGKSFHLPQNLFWTFFVLEKRG